MKTLREVCLQLNITRRVVQGYQAKNLIEPDGTNKYGHLLFKKETVDRIAFIRYLQRMNVPTDDITKILELTSEEMISVIRDSCQRLKREHKAIGELIDKTESLIERLDDKDISSGSLMETIRKEVL